MNITLAWFFKTKWDNTENENKRLIKRSLWLRNIYLATQCWTYSRETLAIRHYLLLGIVVQNSEIRRVLIRSGLESPE